MIELTPRAQLRLNDYLDELRRVLTGSPAVDLADVERDVRDHIDTALAQYPPPVEETVLDRVLKELGSPAQWVPGEARPWYRKSVPEWRSLLQRNVVQFQQNAVHFLRHVVADGPDSYRLAYLSFLVLVVGWCSAGRPRNEAALLFPLVLTLASFILSRAALSLFGPDQLSSGQKWLLYPALLAVYVPLCLVMLLGAATMAGMVLSQLTRQNAISVEQKFFADAIEALDRETVVLSQNLAGSSSNDAEARALRSKLDDLNLNREGLRRLKKQSPRLTTVPGFTLTQIVCGVIAAAGANWLLLGVVGILFPGLFRNIFHPFADRLTRWPGYGLAVLGLLLSLGGLVFVW